jgi:SAM-dependent methyltransferase
MDKRSADRKRSLDEMYAATPDPWDYTANPDEKEKYEATLASIPRGNYATGLEIGCSEGVFTQQLSPRVEHLVGLDISEVALERARKRCPDPSKVEFRQFDLISDEMDAQFELICCSETLYYVPPFKRLPVARKITRWLAPDADLVLVHSLREWTKEWADIYGEGGAERLHQWFSGAMGLEIRQKIRGEGYEILVVRNRPSGASQMKRKAAQLRLLGLSVWPGVVDIARQYLARHPRRRAAAVRVRRFLDRALTARPSRREQDA